jgi:hypothetical protein
MMKEQACVAIQLMLTFYSLQTGSALRSACLPQISLSLGPVYVQNSTD